MRPRQTCVGTDIGFRDRSIFYMKCRAVLGLALARVVETSSGDGGVAEPLLDLGDVGFVGKGVRRRRRAHGMHAQAVHFDVDSGFAPVLGDDVFARFTV